MPRVRNGFRRPSPTTRLGKADGRTGCETRPDRKGKRQASRLPTAGVPPESDTVVEASPGREGLGRTILVAVGVSVVAISGILGFFIGSNGAEAVPEAALFGGLLVLPTTPLSMTAYAVVLSSVVLVCLFGLVELASRMEDAS